MILGDNMAVYFEIVRESVENLCEIITEFSEIIAYKINTGKSVVIHNYIYICQPVQRLALT